MAAGSTVSFVGRLLFALLFLSRYDHDTQLQLSDRGALRAPPFATRSADWAGTLLRQALQNCSGAQKLQSFNVTTGGPVMSLMAPKMDTFLGHIKDAVKIDIPLEKVNVSASLDGTN